MMGHNFWRCELCGKTIMAAGVGAHLHYRHKMSAERKGKVRMWGNQVVARWICYKGGEA